MSTLFQALTTRLPDEPYFITMRRGVRQVTIIARSDGIHLFKTSRLGLCGFGKEIHAKRMAVDGSFF